MKTISRNLNEKNDLIKMLQEIDGNPEIVIWNGYVDDYMNIEKA
ncbi:UNVERIFIED_ORG: hypothetical protein [Escherichia phage CMSTMSU]